MEYLKRIKDKELEAYLKTFGAVLITGPKFCGKSELAKRKAKQVYQMDTDKIVSQIMSSNPAQLLKGEKPILFDEWQEEREIWNHVRHDIDNFKAKGKYILTGSANPIENVKLHSGAGRIARMGLRTMSMQETRNAKPIVKFSDLFSAGKKLPVEESKLLPEDIARLIIKGGWPALAESDTDEAALYLSHYVDLLSETDVSRVSDKKRDPNRVRRLLMAYARNISTCASNETLASDGVSEAMDAATVADYLDALKRLMIIDEIPAFGMHIRSTVQFRKAAKRDFCDPSLACALLGLDEKKLLAEFEYLGFLFESFAAHSIKVYADAMDAKVFYHSDKKGNEADLIVELRDGTYSAFEIKFGAKQEEEAAKSLKKFEKLIPAGNKKPVSLNIIASHGISHTREDGINFIPIECLFLG